MSAEDWDLWSERQKSGLGYFSRGANALLCAKLLYEQMNANKIAYWEGYQREAALCLELIAKAYLCCETGKAPRPSHDTYELWKSAGFVVSDDDEWRLRLASDLLHWSGRYPAPKLLEKPSIYDYGKSSINIHTRRNWQKMEEISLDNVRKIGSVSLVKNISFDYDDVKRMYDYVLEMIEQHPRSFFSK